MSADTLLLENESCVEQTKGYADYPRQRETSIVLVVKAAVRQEDSLSGYLRHVYVFYKNSSTFLLTRAIMFLAAVAIFVTGLMRYHRCDMEPEIPLFLVLEGAAIVIKTAIFVFKACNAKPTDDGDRTGLDTCGDVTSLFLVLWTLSGSVWVFGTYNRVDLAREQASYYCDKLVYLCALGFLLLVYTYAVAMATFATVLSVYYKLSHRQQDTNLYNNFT